MSASTLEIPGSLKRVELPPAFFKWLDSPDGKSAMEAAAAEARSSVQHLNEERTIQPEQLHVPITL